MTREERRLLHALACVCDQYMSTKGELDHAFMGAGELAVTLLAEYGLVDPGGSGGVWTKAGHDLLDSDDWSLL